MKKLAISLILGASLMITPSAFALKAMTDSNMKDTTGQAGVGIALDDVTLYQTVGETMYIDTDGKANDVGVNNRDAQKNPVDFDVAAVIVSGAETLTTLRAIIDHSNRGGFLNDAFGGPGYSKIQQGRGVDGTEVGARQLLGDWDNDTTTVDTWRDIANIRHEVEISALFIDVAGDLEVLGQISGRLNADGSTADDTIAAQAGVSIGLPTIEIAKTGSTKTISTVACDAKGNYDPTAVKEYIQITKGDSVMAILGGNLEIAAH